MGKSAPVGDSEADDPDLRYRVIPRVRVELEPWRGGERPLGRALSQKAVPVLKFGSPGAGDGSR